MQSISVRGVKIGEGRPKIVVPIVAVSADEILADAAAIVHAGAEVIEWRADFYEDVRNIHELDRTLNALRTAIGEIPLIFTIRTSAEGGKIEISDEDYAALLTAAAQNGNADFIDVELFRCGPAIADLVSTLKSKNALTILSNHDFHATPAKDEIVSRLRRMQEVGGDVLKIAVMPQNKADVLTLLSATEEMSGSCEHPLITMAMGGLGCISRLAGEIFGSSMTFGTVGKASAPGQIPIDGLKNCLDEIHQSYIKD